MAEPVGDAFTHTARVARRQSRQKRSQSTGAPSGYGSTWASGAAGKRRALVACRSATATPRLVVGELGDDALQAAAAILAVELEDQTGG